MCHVNLVILGLFFPSMSLETEEKKEIILSYIISCLCEFLFIWQLFKVVS